MDKISAIGDFRHHVRETPYISFDLFDTLIKRRFIHANEVHDTVSVHALAQIGLRRERNPFDLTLLRYRTSDALKASGTQVIQEPPIDLVWDRILSHDVPAAERRAKIVHDIVEFEHAIEMANLGLVDGAKELLLALRSEGKVLIAISDMYFRFDHMKRILEKLEIYDLFDHIYISAEVNLTKQTGDLFRWVMSDLAIAPDEIRHVGDNLRSDAMMASAAGIEPVLVEQPRLLELERPEYGRRDRIEEEIADLIKGHLLSLLFDARDRSVEHIYFMGRDGCEIGRFLRIWRNPVVDRHLTPPPFSDLFLNRVLTCWGDINFSGDWLVQAVGFAFWLNHAEATARELSTLLGIEEVPSSLGDRRLKSSEDTAAIVEAYLEAGLKEKIRASILAKRGLLERYLKEIGFFDKRSVAFSDVGYSGTVLRDINSLLMQRRAEGSPLSPPAMTLHLLATNGNHGPNQVRARPHVDFARPILPAPLLPDELKDSFAWLEFFFKHPTLRPILRFVERDGRLEPDLIEDPNPPVSMPGQRIETFALARDADVALLWMAAIDNFDPLARPLIERFAKPDMATVDQMRDEVFELHSIDGARRSIILEMPQAYPELIAATAKKEDYWIPGSILASSALASGQASPPPAADRARHPLERIIRWLGKSKKRKAAQLPPVAPGFDPRFYGSFYADLRHFETDAQLWRHYVMHGRDEKRVASYASLAAQLGAEFGSVPKSFNPTAYLRHNPDLAGIIDNPGRALDHFMRRGRHEGRLFGSSLNGLINEFEQLRETGKIRFDPQEAKGLAQGETAFELFLKRHDIQVGPWIDELDIVEFRALHSAWCGTVASKAACIIALCERGLPHRPSLSLRAPFNAAYYRRQSNELTELGDEPLYRHYLNAGSAAGLAPSEEAALLRLWGHAEFPAAFDWEAYQAETRQQVRDDRTAVLRHFLAASGTARLSFVRGEDKAPFIECLAIQAWRVHGRKQEAKALYQAALKAGGRAGRIHHFLGDLALEEGQEGEALAHFRAGMQDSAPDRWSFINAANLELKAGDYRAALASLALGRRLWQEMAPWRRIYDRAMRDWCRASGVRLLDPKKSAPSFAEADRIVAEIDAGLPASSRPDGPVQGVLVLTMRAASSERRDRSLTPGVTVYDLKSLEDGDYLGALLRHNEVVLHELPFIYDTLRAIRIARSLGKRTTLWLGDLADWRGHPLAGCAWGARGEDASPLRIENVRELSLAARYCDEVVTTIPGCLSPLRWAAPNASVGMLASAPPSLRGPESKCRVLLAFAHSGIAGADLAPFAADLAARIRQEPSLTPIVNRKLAARHELAGSATRCSVIADDPELPALARIICRSDAVIELRAGVAGSYSLADEAHAHGVPATLAPDKAPAPVKASKGMLAPAGGNAGGPPPANVPPMHPVPALARRKRLLFANVFFAPQLIGGATRVAKDNIDYLLDHHADEFDIAIFASDEQNDLCGEFTVSGYRGVPVFRAATPQEVNMDWRESNPMIGARFAAVLESFKPDLVHIHCLQRLSVTVADACRSRNVPYFVTLHDAWWISDFPFLSDENGVLVAAKRDFADQPRLAGVDPILSLQRAARLRETLLAADRRLAVSASFGRIYEACGIPCETIENGTSRISTLPRAAGSGRVQLCHIGGLQHHKGAYLIEAALRSNRYDNLHFTVVDLARGTGDTTYSVWGTTPVTVTGKMGTDELARFFAEMNVLLAPSTWPESYGLVTREALAHGLWVVAGDLGAIGDPVRENENGFVVSVDDAGGVAAALAAIDRNPGRFHSPPADGIGAARTADDQSRELVSIYRASLAPDDVGIAALRSEHRSH